MPVSPLKRSSRTKTELEEELIAARDEHDSVLAQARQVLHEQLRADIDWWYARAKWLAEHANSRTDQTKVVMVKAVLDKIAPDLRSIGRAGGLHGAGGARVQFNNINMPTAAADPSTATRPINGQSVPDTDS
jgi:hypothetical protein